MLMDKLVVQLNLANNIDVLSLYGVLFIVLGLMFIPLNPYVNFMLLLIFLTIFSNFHKILDKLSKD